MLSCVNCIFFCFIQLFLQALKRDNELRKPAQKAEEESLEQPKSPISSLTETDRSSDILHPVRWVQKFIQIVLICLVNILVLPLSLTFIGRCFVF